MAAAAMLMWMWHNAKSATRNRKKKSYPAQKHTYIYMLKNKTLLSQYQPCEWYGYVFRFRNQAPDGEQRQI